MNSWIFIHIHSNAQSSSHCGGSGKNRSGCFTQRDGGLGTYDTLTICRLLHAITNKGSSWQNASYTILLLLSDSSGVCCMLHCDTWLHKLSSLHKKKTQHPTNTSETRPCHLYSCIINALWLTWMRIVQLQGELLRRHKARQLVSCSSCSH